MDITYLGAGCVKISGKSLNVLCNPYTDDMGLPKLAAKADVVLLSQPEGLGSVPGAMVFDGPGEYEVKDAAVTGVPAQLHTDDGGYRCTVYSIVVDGVNVVVTGNLAGKLDNKQLDHLGNVDVLVVPVGGHGLTLEPEEAAAVVTQLEPSYVIPVHYDDAKTKYPVQQEGVEAFLKEMGAANVEPESKFRLSSKEALGETQVVVLKRVGE